jgi:hypothetical protein
LRMDEPVWFIQIESLPRFLLKPHQIQPRFSNKNK